jgi:hypothetical protein
MKIARNQMTKKSKNFKLNIAEFYFYCNDCESRAADKLDLVADNDDVSLNSTGYSSNFCLLIYHQKSQVN